MTTDFVRDLTKNWRIITMKIFRKLIISKILTKKILKIRFGAIFCDFKPNICAYLELSKKQWIALNLKKS
jgi:hypothetical protein